MPLLSRRYHLRGFIILFLATLFLTTAFGAAETKSSNLVPSETSYHFGTVRRGEIIEHIFLLKNKSKSKVKITKVEAKGGLTRVKVKNEIMPGHAGQITLILETFDLAGQVEAEAILHTDNLEQPRLELKLVGNVKTPVVEIKPMPAVFLAAFRGEAKESTFTIVNHGEEPLEVLGLEAQSQRFQAEVQPMKAGKEYKVTVKVNPKAEGVGKTKNNLLVFTSHPEFPEIRVPVNIFLKGDVYSFPDQYDLGKISLKKLKEAIKKSPETVKSMTQTILVKRRPGKGRDFQIKVEHSIPFFQIKQTPENSESYRLDVALVPEKLKPGKINTFIKVKTNDKEVSELKIPVTGEII